MDAKQLEVRIVWHSDDAPEPADEGAPPSLPVQLFRQLQSDPRAGGNDGAGISVWFHQGGTAADGTASLPPDVPLPADRETVIVLLVGNALLADDDWMTWCHDLRVAVEARPADAMLVPIALVERAVGQHWMLNELAAERVFDQPNIIERDRGVRIAVLRKLARLQRRGEDGTIGKLQVFVSHAKADGRRVARAMADHLDELKGEAWIDVERIESGDNFRDVLDKALGQDTIFVAVVSDAYSTREWCRWEAQIARQRGLPTVVLDMVTEGQRRSLPALGNVPVIRYNAPAARDDDAPMSPEGVVACRRVMEAVLLESVTNHAFDARVQLMAARLGLPESSLASFSPQPDLLALVSRAPQLSAASRAIYPDPPLPDFELEMLSGVAGDLTFTTPLALMHEVKTGSAALRVAVSISSPAPEELRLRRMGAEHVDALFMDMCRFLLACGHTIAYGGDPMKNFTVALGDLERTYRFSDPAGDRRLVNYVAPYLHNAPAFQGELGDVMRIEKVRRTTDPDATGDLALMLDLTGMRRAMLAGTDVRIVAAGDLMPGATPGSRRGPGVVEEAYLSLLAGQPLLVVGGFGGAGRLIADALSGRLDPQELGRLEVHFAGADAFEGTAEAHTFRQMIEALKPGVELHNQLSAEENDTLLHATDIDEIAALLVSAVQRISGDQHGR